MKKIAILGSTGSIGTQALEIIDMHKEEYVLEAMTFGANIDLAREQITTYTPRRVCCMKEEHAILLQKEFACIEFCYGKEGLSEIAKSEYDIMLNSLVGMIGLVPTAEAIKKGRIISLANKETLVTGGEYIMDLLKNSDSRLIPVDSEHSAIFQSLMGNEHNNVSKILLTASGGPFRGYEKERLHEVTLEQALKHPNWTMGKKITIDSATMMNKGLEVIEAKWLFDIAPSDIEVLIHKESIVHSMVQFEDASIIAQLGTPDMKVPIGFAFSYPNRIETGAKPLNFFEEADSLTFTKPDLNTFECLKMAYDAIEKGGSYPIVLNAANEVLVDLFLNKKISFIDIQNNIKNILDIHKQVIKLDLETILNIDEETRIITRKRCKI